MLVVRMPRSNNVGEEMWQWDPIITIGCYASDKDSIPLSRDRVQPHKSGTHPGSMHSFMTNIWKINLRSNPVGKVVVVSSIEIDVCSVP